MNKQLRILLAGAMIIVPFAITIWVIVAIGSGLDNLVRDPLAKLFHDPLAEEKFELWPGVGVLIMIGVTYLIGLLTHFWLFRKLLSVFERFVARLPGVKTIYESVRDLMKLFGTGSRRMGRVVRYKPPGTDMVFLGILTNEAPKIGQSPDDRPVAVFLPYSYMFGGMTIYVSPEHLQEVDMPVEQALKLSATAQVGGESPPKARPKLPEGGSND